MIGCGPQSDENVGSPVSVEKPAICLDPLMAYAYALDPPSVPASARLPVVPFAVVGIKIAAWSSVGVCAPPETQPASLMALAPL